MSTGLMMMMMMPLYDVQISPESVPIDDLFAVARGKRYFIMSDLSTNCHSSPLSLVDSVPCRCAAPLLP